MAEETAPAVSLPVSSGLSRGVGGVVEDPERHDARDAWRSRRCEARADEDDMTADRQVTALLEFKPLGERFIGDGVIEAVACAAVPANVKAGTP
ncbi:hypothetical protein AB0N89_02555 [Amycolatopsis sp. NPDC089917]|uniref:hypothetical protein n=1 Tax=Amycolatopsis sp. NPDC089917 TaxID=3155187 RepID=UPI003425E8E4